MAKPRNEATLRCIIDAAWSSFITSGLQSTSYESISKKSGVSKPLIQHYFPKKEDLVIAGVSKLRESSQVQAERMVEEDADSFRCLYILGQIYLKALLATKATRRFLAETLESRKLTAAVMDFDYDWSLAQLEFSKEYEERREFFREQTLERMGGFYEIIYRRLNDSKHIDVPESMYHTMAGIMGDFGMEKSKIQTYLKEWTLDEGVLEQAANDALFASLQ